MENSECPKCQSTHVVKSGIINQRQRFHCKKCNYFFTVNKLGKKIPIFLASNCKNTFNDDGDGCDCIN